ETRVSFVDQPVGQTASPLQIHRGVRVESPREASHDSEPNVIEMPPLDVRDLLLSDTGSPRQIHLAPPEPPAQRPNDQPHAAIVHGRRMSPGAYLALITAFTTAYARNGRNYPPML